MFIFAERCLKRTHVQFHSFHLKINLENVRTKRPDAALTQNDVIYSSDDVEGFSFRCVECYCCPAEGSLSLCVCVSAAEGGCAAGGEGI